MPISDKIAEFIDAALAAGIPNDSLVGILVSQGWPEKEVYRGLAEYYERRTGINIPRRLESAASAKDAFFYLVIFSTLATWTIGYGYLAFAIIDRWLSDPLFHAYRQGLDIFSTTTSLASLIVAFPVYLLVSRTVNADLEASPEKLESPVRKWLTYMALVIAAGVLIGDLITALDYLLRGEITTRFVAKCLVVLALAGGVFFYYFGGLRKVGIAKGGFSRNKLMGGLSAVAVALVAVLGFVQLGSPNEQRAFRADRQRVLQIYQLSTAVTMYWNAHAAQAPRSLDQLPGASYLDPVTSKPFAYRVKQDGQYEICATFDRSSGNQQDISGMEAWKHSAGHSCFQLDASAAPPFNQQMFQEY